MPTVIVPGGEIFYSSRGHGPICLVPSCIGTRPYERQMTGPLSEHVTLAFVDVRGGGRSTGDPASLTFDSLAADLEAVRGALGAERVAVLGHSILGILAIEYARRCPHRVSHVIAVGTPPRGDMAWLQEQGTACFEQRASPERKRRLRENLAALPANASPGEALRAQAPLRFHDASFDPGPLMAEAEYRPALLARVMGELTPAWDVRTDAASLRVPLLLAHGRHDYVVPGSLWDGIIEGLPDATLRLFERSGHQPFFEEPDEFAAAVLEWMASRA